MEIDLESLQVKLFLVIFQWNEMLFLGYKNVEYFQLLKVDTN